MRTLLGENPDSYTLEEKCSIIQAYKKGGGVAGLADIIDDDNEEDAENFGTQGGQGEGNERGSAPAEQMDDEDVDIDLEDPNDVKIIEQEFRKLYEKDEDFKNNFGEDAFELGPLQKYQIIDAYNKNGTEGVLALLTTSHDQSGIMNQMEGDQSKAEESMIEHNGKKYSRIAIEGLGDDDEYLMDENGDIFSLDFKFITNMGDNVVIEE